MMSRHNSSERRDLTRALMMARDAILSNKRHLESMGRNATAGTHEALDEIDNVLSPPNNKVSGPEPAAKGTP